MSLGSVLQKRPQWRPMGSTKIGRCLTPLLGNIPGPWLPTLPQTSPLLQSDWSWLNRALNLPFENIAWGRRMMVLAVDRTSGLWRAHLNLLCTGMDTEALWGLCNLRKEGLCFDVVRHLHPDAIRNTGGELCTNPWASWDEGFYQSLRRGITDWCLNK